MLKLTATGLPRFVDCNGQRLLDKVPAFNNDSSLRDEGNAAHWLVEKVFKGEYIAEELIDRKAPNGWIIDADMVEHCDAYLNAIEGFGAVESDTSYGGEKWFIGGQADHIGVVKNILYVDDFKFGWRIIEPDENWTLLSHAFGFLSKNPDIGKTVDTVVIRIFQPRPYHPRGAVREWHVSVQDLWGVYWAKLSPMLENPSDVLNTGPNCYKCPSRYPCPAAQISSMNAIDVSETAFNSDLKPDEVSLILDQLKRAQDVIKQTLKSYEDAALHQAKKGVIFPNHAIQSDISNEQWKEGITPEMMMLITGQDLSKKSLITPGQAKKKGIDPKILEPFYERKTKGAKLVSVKNSERAKQLFGNKKT